MKAKLLSPFLLAGMMSSASAVTTLFDYGYNIDGSADAHSAIFGDGDPVPGVADESGFDTLTGLGTIVITISGAGGHHVALMLDHEIDEGLNGFTNETGFISGAPAAGQTGEIDEPGFIDGDIFINLEDGLGFDGGVGTSIFGPTIFPDDVSMALAWDFTLLAGETAEIDFLVSETAPAGGYFLEHHDPDSDASIYFSSTIDIMGGQPPGVPDGGFTIAMLGLALAGLGVFGHKSKRH